MICPACLRGDHHECAIEIILGDCEGYECMCLCTPDYDEELEIEEGR